MNASLTTAAQTFALIALPILVAWFGESFRRLLVARHYRTDVYDALSRAIATGYAASQKTGLAITTATGMATAVDAGLAYWTTQVPNKMTAIGMTETAAASILQAGLNDYATTKAIVPAVTAVSVAAT